MAAVAIWSVLVQPGKKTKFVAQSDIRVTSAALDATLADETSRSSVKFTYITPQAIDDDSDEPLPEKTATILCSLTPGKIEQASLDIILGEDEELEFEVVGKNAIYLNGNYITQEPDTQDNYSDSEIEDTYDLRDVSSDVEIDPAELDMLSGSDEEDDSNRFEEITTNGKSPDDKPSKKRPLDLDAMEIEPDSNGEGPQKLSKKEQKKLNKKLKTEHASETVQVNGDAKGDSAKVDKKEKKEKKDKKKEKDGEKSEPPKKESDMKELPGGLQIKDVKVGTGKVAKNGDLVSMRYIGKFPNGKLFDQNVKGKPFSFKIGAGEVIKGWDEGIAGMQAGGERLLIVPPKLGYGNRKIDGIPAGSTLRFEVKLLEIK